MRRSICCLAAIGFAVLASGCGHVHSRVLTEPADIVGFKQVSVAPIQVTSTEQNPDAFALNEQWRRIAQSELVNALNAKGIATSLPPHASVDCAINVTYGSRALRYFVGFGAGSGHVRVAITLRDLNGTVRYATVSEADLGGGAFGGNMAPVAEAAVRAAIQEFVSRL
jgi:hypothetical protein